ncbi:MAG: L,D-transpeptidase family protein, partial [Bacteroidota bacterium]|nr:L,D-transpeptidase family protein [Bacteroidota bacterium]
LGLIMLVFFSCSQGNDRKKIKESYNETLYDYDNDDVDFISFKLDEKPDKAILANLLKEKLDTAGLEPYFPNNKERKELEDKLRGFYEEYDYEIVWTSSGGINSQAKELLDALHNVSEEGLNAAHYNLHKFEDLFKKLNDGSGEDQNENLVKLDLLFTSSYLVLGSDLSTGRLNPYKFDNRWIPAVPEKDLKDHLIEAYESNRIRESFNDLIPDHPQYTKLKEALIQYKKLADEYQWEVIEIDSVIQKGDSGQIIAEIRQRLDFLGDLESGTVEATAAKFDASMESAVKSFQKRHGLLADGILGPNTYDKLNIPLEAKINQLKLNLEKVRWLPRELGKEYILVNVPEFRLRVYNNNNIVDEMKVIVGKEFTSTPIFSDTLEYLAFSPDWTVPVSILRENIFDHILQDPGYLERNNYELYLDWDQNSEPVDPFSIDWHEVDREEINYRLVQKPGPWNALGQVKFMMPNDMAIYLHDTPTSYLFDEKIRGFSHGCVRVERPLDLAEFLLKEDISWDRNRIYQYLNLDEPENVILPNKVPVHIVYKTAWVDEAGDVYFLSDIYNHDEIQMAALEKTLTSNSF